MTTTAPNKQPRPLVLLRPLPDRTPIHDLWAGTKLLAVAGLGVLLALYPGWFTLTTVLLLVVGTARLARVPRGALPSVPRWVWIVLVLGGATAAAAGGAPYLHLGSVSLEVGGLLSYLQLTLLSVALLGLSALVQWTTNVAEIAPAVAKLGAPLRMLRVPVDDWAVTLALALRAFPMLLDEYRTLFAARRLRPRDTANTRRERLRRAFAELVDLLATAMTVSLRRADEMGDAITARGGSGQISAYPSRPATVDAVALAVVTALGVLSVYLEFAGPLTGT